MKIKLFGVTIFEKTNGAEPHKDGAMYPATTLNPAYTVIKTTTKEPKPVAKKRGYHDWSFYTNQVLRSPDKTVVISDHVCVRAEHSCLMAASVQSVCKNRGRPVTVKHTPARPKGQMSTLTFTKKETKLS